MAPKSSIILAGALVLLLASAAMSIEIQEGQGGQSGNLFGGFGSGLGNFLGGFGKQGQQQQQQQQEGQQQQLGGLLGGGLLGGAGLLGGDQKKEGGELAEKKEAGKEGLLGVKGPVELAKLLLNPAELIKQIATFFKLEKTGLVDLLGKGFTTGLEVALSPALLSIKIIEKVFVPDNCKLKFICDLGKPIQAFKGAIPKFSPGLLDGASSLKALNDGIFSHECEQLYPCGGELKLKKEFEVLKNPLAHANQIIKGGGSESFNQQDGEHQGEHFGGEHASIDETQ